MYRASIAILVLAVAGCAHDVANRYYSTQKYPEKRTEEVSLLSSAPSRPFDVIADFQSRGDSPESLRDRAAKIGADAVIVSKFGGFVPNANEWADDKSYHSGFDDRIVGTAIRYK